MKNKKHMATLALLLIGIVNILAFQIVVDRKIDLVEVPFAKVDIKPRTKIDETMIGYKKVPKMYVDELCYENKKQVMGKYTEISGLIPKGSLFYKSMLYQKKQMPDYPSLQLKQGQTAYSLPSDLVKLSGNTITSNQKVDVYVTIPQKKENPIIDRLVKGVRVLSIKDRKGLDIDDEDSTKIPYVVILAVSDEIVPYLNTAAKIGSIDLYAPAADYGKDEESIFIAESKVLPYLNHE